MYLTYLSKIFGILSQIFYFDNITTTYLNDMIMAVAIPLIFRGNISPKRANNTGATPIP